jgi:5'-nucleotidase (lipoprotein e(P4) family)
MRSTLAIRVAAAAVVVALGMSGCAAPKIQLHWLSAHQWATASAEYAAVSLQTYAAARSKLPVALADTSWTACLEQRPGFESLPPAIVVDLDETVLDNRPFQLRLVREGREFDEEMWNDWVREKNVDLVPGSLEFLQEADRLGIEIFYVTNREFEVEEPTRETLVALGLPLSSERDTLMTQGERPEWGSDKVERRTRVATTHRVLLMVGDHLRDFVQVDDRSKEKRREVAFRHAGMWGEKWFMLPNPIYGGWVAQSRAELFSE